MMRSGLRQCPRVRNRKSLQTGHGCPQTGEQVAGEHADSRTWGCVASRMGLCGTPAAVIRPSH